MLGHSSNRMVDADYGYLSKNYVSEQLRRTLRHTRLMEDFIGRNVERFGKKMCLQLCDRHEIDPVYILH